MMKKAIFISGLISIMLINTAYSQEKTLRGYVYDSLSLNPVYNSYIINRNNNDIVLTNEYGFFVYTTQDDTLKIECSHVGYEPFKLDFAVNQDTILKLLLQPVKLKEVKVTAASEPAYKQALLGKVMFSMEEVESIPSFIGEPDLMKAITHTPGVSGGREGFSNIYIRGGGRGQNLILSDGVKLYNTNHLGGFLSAINSDVIKDIDIYKGGFPARFGGRSSSVIDIHTREGNKFDLKGKYSVGVLQSAFLLEGPLKTDKTSFLFAARGSYLDLLTIPYRIKYNRGNAGSMLGYTFADFNFRVDHKFNRGRKLSLILYQANDIMDSEDGHSIHYLSEGMKIRNSSINLITTNSPAPEIFTRSQLIYSGYSSKYYAIDNNNNIPDKYESYFENKSVLNEINIKYQLSWYPDNRFTFKTGFDGNMNLYSPGISRAQINYITTQTSYDTITGLKYKQKSYQAAAFIEGDIVLSSKVNINSGIRLSFYNSGLFHDFSLEPRMSLRILLSDNISVKTGITKMSQNSHPLISNYQGFEKEIWIPATDSLPTQQAIQYSTGIFGLIEPLNIEFSLEGYYKVLSNSYFFRPSVSVFEDYSELSKYLTAGGKNKSYGIELSTRYTIKKLLLDLSYTFSKSTLQFESLNNGKAFPSDFDRRHDLSLVSRLKISDQSFINARFVFSSGTPFTLPVSYNPNNIFFEGYYNYSMINNVRLPSYHRLDIGLEKQGITKKGNTKILKINIYNIYARQNPVYIYLDSYTGDIYQKALFTILPTISYSVNF